MSEIDELKAEIERLREAHRDLMGRLGFGDNVTEPMADNDTIVEWSDRQARDADEWRESQQWRVECEVVKGHDPLNDCHECDPTLRLDLAERRLGAVAALLDNRHGECRNCRLSVCRCWMDEIRAALAPVSGAVEGVGAARARVLAYLQGLDAFYSDDEEPDDVVDYVDGGSDSPALRLSDLRAAIGHQSPVSVHEQEVRAEAERAVIEREHDLLRDCTDDSHRGAVARRMWAERTLKVTRWSWWRSAGIGAQDAEITRIADGLGALLAARTPGARDE